MRIDISQLEFIDRRLRALTVWLEAETGIEFTITSLYRIKDTGVHGQLPLRGIDLRCRSKFLGRGLEMMINEAWGYDATRPEKNCAKLHGDGSNLHLHIQVHQNTRRRD